VECLRTRVSLSRSAGGFPVSVVVCYVLQVSSETQANYLSMKLNSYAAALLAAFAFTAPAQANDDWSVTEQQLWDAGYEYGFEYGSLATTCVHYAFGDLSKNDFVRAVEARKDEPEWMQKRFITAFSNPELEQNKLCGPIVRSILAPTQRQQPAHRNAVYQNAIY
jgi:hypothetical protein